MLSILADLSFLNGVDASCMLLVLMDGYAAALRIESRWISSSFVRLSGFIHQTFGRGGRGSIFVGKEGEPSSSIS